MEHRWLVCPQNPELSSALAAELDIHPSLAQVLINRGARSAGSANRFLLSSLKQLRNPFDLPDLDRAADRLTLAVLDDQPLGIYGDYDADGLTSVAVFKSFFRDLGLDCIHYIPNRLSDGYGLNEEGLVYFKKAGVELVVTADCGSTDIVQARRAADMGLELIITDHHQLDRELPPALAVINPWRPDGPEEFHGLAGVGVVFYLLAGLRVKLRQAGFFDSRPEPNLKQLLDMVALGTIADVAPMTGQNRILVKSGLEVLGGSPRPGLAALATVSRAGETITARDILFGLAPRINAPGRLGSTEVVLDLLMSTDRDRALSYARAIDKLNTERRAIERQVLQAAKAQLKTEGDPRQSMALVAADPEWHRGVLGIVAARLSRLYNRPSLVLSVDGDTATGSGRSIEAVHLFKTLKGLSKYLIQFGGHSQAAGLKLDSDQIRPFAMALNASVGAALASADMTPTLNVDTALELDEIDEPFLAALERLAPFGPGNQEPVFAADNVGLSSVRAVGRDGAHLSLMLRQGSRSWPGIGFDLGPLARRLRGRASVAFRPFTDSYNGRERIKLQVLGVQSS